MADIIKAAVEGDLVAVHNLILTDRKNVCIKDEVI